MVTQGILEPVQSGGVTNESPVVWQRKKSGELRLCVDLKVHMNGKVTDEDYPIPDMETIFHKLHEASYFGKNDPSDAYYQIELDEEAKHICTINASQWLFKMCRLPQGLKTLIQSTRIASNQLLKESKGVVIFQHDVAIELPGNTSIKECLQSGVDNVRKILLLMKKVQIKTSRKR